MKLSLNILLLPGYHDTIYTGHLMSKLIDPKNYLITDTVTILVHLLLNM
jgi:hypothetical protein